MPSRDIIRCHQYLQDRWPKLKAMFEKDNPDYTLKLVCTYRSVKEQQMLYAQGRTVFPGRIVTNIDGVTRMGMHNYDPARAFDVGVFKGKEYITDTHLYRFGEYADKLGLVWGGDWKRFKDYPHFETPKGAVA